MARRALEPLAPLEKRPKVATRPLGRIPVPSELKRLLTKEEVLVASSLFKELTGSESEHLADRATITVEAICELPDVAKQLEACPNLGVLLQEANSAFLAYLRFAPLPWRFREFLRMLCPTADEKELELFEDWARADIRAGSFPTGRPNVQKRRPQRPASRGSLATINRPAPVVGSLRPGMAARMASKVEAERAEQERVEAEEIPEAEPTSPTPSTISRPAETTEAIEHKAKVKEYVQQRYLELMLVDGLDPTAACARALLEVPNRVVPQTPMIAAQ